MKKLTIIITASFALMFTSCAKQPTPKTTTPQEAQAESSSSTGSKIVGYGLGYIFGAVLASGLIN